MENEEDNSGAYQALSVFTMKYDPAGEDTATDYFTSKEIRSIVFRHTGIDLSLGEIHNLMRDMHFHYKLDGLEFKWLCRISG